MNRNLRNAPAGPTSPLIGTVKWFNGSKGFGFLISPDVNQGKLDIFVHHTALNMEGYRNLIEGQTVRFDLYEGEKGPTAQNVEVVS
jgi:cold shock protein